MLVKIVTFFLIGMVVLAMFGRLTVPGRDRIARLRGKCPACGAPRIGRATCPCGKG
jgi:hypothetical protein